MAVPQDIQSLLDQYEAVEQDASKLMAGIDENQGTWRANEDSWSIAECLDHLDAANRIYLAALEPAAVNARKSGRLRRDSAMPGLIGGWFVKQMEPPVRPKFKMKSPTSIRPRKSPELASTFAQFISSHQAMQNFVRENADLDLAHVHFQNPFIPVIFFSLATGVHVIPAHARRHLLQAWRVREDYLLTGSKTK